MKNGRRCPIEDYRLQYDVPHESSLADSISKHGSELSAIAKRNKKEMKLACHERGALFLDDMFQGESAEEGKLV